MSAEQLKDEGNKKYTNQDFQGAIDLYTKAIELNPSNATYYANRAAAYSAIKQYTQAIADCTKAIQLDPKYVKAYFRRGKLFMIGGNLDEAAMEFKQCLQLEPKNKQAKDELGTIEGIKTLLSRGYDSLKQSNFGEALGEFRNLLNISPEFNSAKLGYAEALVGLKKYLEAQSEISNVLKVQPNNVQALYLRALVKYFLGELPAALTILNTILVDLDPDNSKAFQLRRSAKAITTLKEKGNDAFKDGRTEEAIKYYSEALEQDPNLDLVNAQLHHNLGAAYQKLQQYEQAIEHLSQAIDKDENYVKAYVRRSQCHKEIGKYQEAVRDLEMANLKSPQKDKALKRELEDLKAKAKKAARKDYYKIMELTKSATEHEIRRAYKRLAREKHPDKHPENPEEAEQQFKELQEAYSVLSDPKKKARYDNGADLEDIENGSGMYGEHPFFSRGGGSRGGFSPFNFSHDGGQGYSFHFG